MLRPLFLHCGWRTGGTWLWSQLRHRDDVLGLFEPLHESLATLTARTLPGVRPGATESGHPDPDRPYFQEYLPLMSPQHPGVRGYRLEFAFDQFFADRDAELPQLRRYLESLVEFSRILGKTPVFKFCRSLGRVGWLRKNFPDALHVLVAREPWSQWLSAWRIFRHDENPYFIVAPMRILEAHRTKPLVAAVASEMKLRLEDFALPRRHAPACKVIRSIPPATLYRLFLTFWVATSLTSTPDVDAVIETDRLTGTAYRAETEQMFRSQGIDIDLSAAHSLERSRLTLESFDDERALRDALATLVRVREVAHVDARVTNRR